MSERSDGNAGTEGKQQCPRCHDWYQRLSAHEGKGACIKKQAQLQKASLATINLGNGDVPNLQRLRETVPIAPRIPRRARTKTAAAFATLIQACVNENTPSSWWKLLVFAYSALSLPGQSKDKKHRQSLTSVINTNLDNMSANATIDASSRAFPKQTDDEASSKRVVAKLRDGDISGAVRLLTSNDLVVKPTLESLRKMQEKHPASAEIELPVLPQGLDEAPPVTVEEVLGAIRSFRPGSSGGPGGLTPQHLKDMVADNRNPASLKLCDALADLATLMIRGEVPAVIVPMIYGANLTALGKKAGGVRPIAAGTTLRRLVGKIVCKRVQISVGNVLRPVQLGFGTRAGCEAIVHAVRHYYGSEKEGAKVVLKLDYKNAFNVIHRGKILQAALDYMPEYARFVFQCYKQPSNLYFGKYIIQSERGVQQRDPLGPVLYSLVTLPTAQLLRSTVKLMYLDDTTIGGTVEDVLEDFGTIIGAAGELGLELNFDKCEVFVNGVSEQEAEQIRERFRDLSTALKFPHDSEFCLLGAPVTDEAIPGSFEEKCACLTRFVSRLPLLTAHESLFLLRNCGATPKLQYVLRTSKVWKYPAVLDEFDGLLKTAVADLTNIAMTESRWKQTSLPVRKSGLGIRRAATLALPAFLASAFAVRDIFGQVTDTDIEDYAADAVELWKQTTKAEPPKGSLRGVQKEWDIPLVELVFQELLAACEGDVYAVARLLACSSSVAGAWLHALPLRALRTALKNEELRTAVALRLGAPICHEHVCRCGEIADARGYHGLSCLTGGAAGQRHDEICDVLCQAANTGGLRARREPLGLCKRDGKRPDIVTALPIARGLPWASDFTCVNTMATTYLPKTTMKAGGGAEAREQYKFGLYAELHEEYYFSGIGIETFGTYGPEAAKIISRLGGLIREKTDEARSCEFLKQRLSVCLQRANARCVLGTFREMRGLEEVFYAVFR